MSAPPRAERAQLALVAALLATLAALAVPHALSTPRGPAAPIAITLRVDPNTATADELCLLPGVGPRIAAEIVRYRESAAQRPAFRTAADLNRVPRVGPALLGRLTPHLRLPAAADTPLAAAP